MKENSKTDLKPQIFNYKPKFTSQSHLIISDKMIFKLKIKSKLKSFIKRIKFKFNKF